MANTAELHLQEALDAYDFGAPLVGAVRFGKGHINDTFCVHTQPLEGDCVRFILQRVSNAAFSRPDQLMANVVGVTDYLRKGESFDKAGAYAIQGEGAALVDHYDGSLDTIIGLPTTRLIKEFPDLVNAEAAEC